MLNSMTTLVARRHSSNFLIVRLFVKSCKSYRKDISKISESATNYFAFKVHFQHHLINPFKSLFAVSCDQSVKKINMHTQNAVFHTIFLHTVFLLIFILWLLSLIISLIHCNFPPVCIDSGQ